jgi:hypothetical protein
MMATPKAFATRETAFPLNHFFPRRNLTGSQNGFHQFVLAAHNHFRKSFEPPTFRNCWLSNEPVSELTELISRNFALRNSIEQVIQQCRRKILYLGCFPQRSTATSRLYRPCRVSDRSIAAGS